jgi:hypothetical protein
MLFYYENLDSKTHVIYTAFIQVGPALAQAFPPFLTYYY